MSDEKLNFEHTFRSHQYTNRGGALSVIIIENSTNITINIDECQFKNNFAKTAGGGTYIYVEGMNTNHSILISSCQFEDNTVSYAGGGVLVSFLISNLNTPTVVDMSDCLFFNNTAELGGGLAMIQTHRFSSGNYIKLVRSNFTRNRVAKEGSAAMFGSHLSVHSQNLVLFSLINNW